MTKRLRILHKIFSVISGLSLVFNSILPASILPILFAAPAYAQTETPTDAPTPTDTTTIAPTPTDAVTPTPEATPTIIETPTEIPTPTEEVTPTPTITEETVPTATTTEPPHETSPPAEQGQILDGASTTAPTPTTVTTPTPEPEHGTLQAMILSNTNAQTLDINFDSNQPSGSATLTTDKSDYAPTDAAVISGTGFMPDYPYKLIISSSDSPAVDFQTEIKTDSTGDFIYSYQLDGNYRPNYSVTVKKGDTIIATTTFTDSVPFPSQTVPGACMADQPNSVVGSCTANDISLASVSLVSINGGHGCRYIGDTVNFTANWQVQSSSNERYNVGLWFATGGQTDPLHGQCSISTLPSGNSPFFEEAPTTDTCGDIKGSGPGMITLTMDVTCIDTNGDNKLDLPYCASWLQNKNEDIACTSPIGTLPGTGSKCKCSNGFTVPIDVPPAVEVIKSLSPINDIGKFNLQINGQTAGTGANVGDGGKTGKIGVTAGPITIGETAETGTSLGNYTSNVSCVLRGTTTAITPTGTTNPWTITVSNGQDIVCTITNTRNPGTLTVNKVLVPSNDTGKFNLQIDGGTAGTGANVGNSGTTGAVSVSAGAHTIGETAGTGSILSNYTSVISGDCAPDGSVTVPSGGAKVCTITNTLNHGSLKIIKNTTGGDTKFDYSVTGPTSYTTSITTSGGTGSAGPANVDSGTTYAIAESGLTDWNFGSATCDKTYTAASNGVTGVAVLPGQTTTCTFTNTKVAKLTVHKVVINHGLSYDTTHFAPYKVDTTEVTLDQATVFNAGNHTVTETSDSRYTTTFSGACDRTGNVTLAAGDDVTCTITNEEKPAHLTVNKTVINHGLTNDVTHFAPYKVGTTTVSLGASNIFDSGIYTVTEKTDPNYTATFSGACNSSGVVTLNPGDDKTCTITNEEIPTHLTIEKVVINHGLTNDATYFAPYTIDGNSVTLGASNIVNSGTHTVAETTDSNYTQTFSSNCLRGSMTLSPGDNATCTITNEEIPTHLTVTKVVINHGGNKQISDFPLFIDTAGVTSGVSNLINSGTHTVSETGNTKYTATITGNCAADGTITLNPGDSKSCTITNEEKPAKVIIHKIVINHGLTNDASHFAPYKVGNTTVTLDTETVMNSGTYVVSEKTDSNYSSSFTAGDCDANGNITLVAGETKSCTITNEEIPTHLTIEKVVINHGLTNDATYFAPYTIDGNSVTLGASNIVNSGTHTVAETTDSNYTQTFSSNCLRGSMTLSPGDNATCTITNEEKTSTITVHKIVTNHGLANGASHFAPYKVGTTTVTLDNATAIDSGTYTVSEKTDPNYTSSFTAGDCDANGEVTVTPGSTKSCTITNEEIPTYLTVTKTVDPSDDSGKFNLQIDDVTKVSDIGNGGTTDKVIVNSGRHTVGEIAGTNTSLGDYTSVIGGDCTSNGTISLTSGDDKTCSITNTRDTGTVELRKVWSGTPGQTTLNIGASAGGTDVASQETGTAGTNPLTTGVKTVNTGTYYVSEAGGLTDYATALVCTDNGRAVTPGTDNSLTVTKNHAVVCTFTNTRKTGTLLVHKIQDTNGDGTFDTLDSADFTWGTDGNTYPYAMGSTGETLDTGSYKVYESTVSGYQFEGWYPGAPQRGEERKDYFCDWQSQSLPGNVTVAYGQTTEVTLCNKFLNPILTITKENNTGGADLSPGANVLYTLTVTATQSAAFNVTVTDLLPAGFTYRPGSWTANTTNVGRGTAGDLKAGGITTEPTYASPGVWQLGDMSKDETVTLTYIADISNAQQAGLYHDIAWAAGCKTDATCTNDVLAFALPLGYIAENYVGTDVNIVTNTQNGLSHNVINTVEGQVLGASTELPNTGANAFWLYIAFGLISGGLSIGALGWFLRRKYA